MCQKKETPDVQDKPVKHGKYISMTISPSREEHVQNKKAGDLLAKVPEHDKEIGQRQNLNDYELIQDEYLRNLGMTYLMDKKYHTCQIEEFRQMQKK